MVTQTELTYSTELKGGARCFHRNTANQVGFDTNKDYRAPGYLIYFRH